MQEQNIHHESRLARNPVFASQQQKQTTHKAANGPVSLVHLSN
jgi:hypothetical protein